MNHYDPNLLSVMLAERRSDLRSAATPSRVTSTNTSPRTWLRRLDVAALRRPGPDLTLLCRAQ